jgi:hypothetical protein
MGAGIVTRCARFRDIAPAPSKAKEEQVRSVSRREVVGGLALGAVALLRGKTSKSVDEPL